MLFGLKYIRKSILLPNTAEVAALTLFTFIHVLIEKLPEDVPSLDYGHTLGC
jgi:hypothetical protein